MSADDITQSLRADLASLQLGDSFFPSGAVSSSLGLETLQAEGHVRDAADVERFLLEQVRERWARSDRAFLAAAHGAGDDLAAVQRIDARQEAMTLAAELRDGSRRSGAALLGVHARLGMARAEAYRTLVRADAAPGHLAVVQGLVCGAAGLSRTRAETVALHGLAVAVLGAALRLGLIGHLDAQRSLGALHPTMAEILARPAPAPEAAESYVPVADVAVMRHEVQDSRLFAN